jgi:hypothetical protein
MSNLVNKSFITKAIETALTAGGSAFTGALVFTNGEPTVKGLEAAAIAFGGATLYSFIKQLGSSQTLTQIEQLANVPPERRSVN